jgi:cobalt/nickel transport system permease protein
MRTTEYILHHLRYIDHCSTRTGGIYRYGVGVKGGITLGVLILLIVIPLSNPLRVMPFLFLPLLISLWARISYLRVWMHSLVVMPFLLLFALMHPLPQFITLMLRGVIALQMVYLFLCTTGMTHLCKGMHRMGAWSKLAGILILSHRYLILLMEEQLRMQQIVASRGYGKRRYVASLWLRMAGNLLLRSLDRAERIQRAMVARGGKECGV